MTLAQTQFVTDLCFCLQKHNPDVPDIPNKLIKPARRNNLLNQRKFWNTVLDHTGTLERIYTQKNLHMAALPLNILSPTPLSHDLIWNLITADPSFNSRKNDKLPRMEDYLDLFPNADAQQLPETDLRERFLENIQPLLTIANNNGFEYMRKFL